MNTAYRVWDGERMHYWDDEGIRLVFEHDGSWFLWLNGMIAHSGDEKSDLMWGAGLKDKNEKMIYEYDIDMIDNEPMVVAYIDGQWGLKFPNDPTHFEDCIDWGECDIVGNVFENPDLLEGAE
ncbi:YopX family protein [Bacillus atrophaeus]|uniref:YopX family protein n=1 Tax=Bacillus atrophaeus TaxID=1452 RepID=UPI002E21312A|nr:YopX family protein [Bacillus atrophaeus]MED4823304.1 YopX family protein [Bacillus atrophaeus]MED4842854.1 YopX family protein [Bacillus atrophaeus]